MADTIMNEKTIAEIAKLARQAGQSIDIGGVPYAVIPTDCKIEDLSRFRFNDYAATPHRKKVSVNVMDAASFIEYYQQFSDENSRVFADETQSIVKAVLDYHGAHSEGSPRWCQHILILKLRPAPEWTVWTEKNGQARKMTQMDFAEFIEDNAPDIVEPNAATMLEMARTLQAKTDVDFSSAIRMSNGQIQCTYNEQVKGTYGSGKVDIPEQFKISIPVYVGGERTPIIARLRYRLQNGKLSIWYDLLRHSEVERKAFTAQIAAIKDTLKIAVINGMPA